MKEGLGNIPIIAIIIVFITFVSGYLAYNVNYTKAFKMKNKIISVYEEYNGQCGSECKSKIGAYAQEIGYSYLNLTESDCNDERFVPVGVVNSGSFANNYYGYCEYKVQDLISPDWVVNECVERYHYRILTKINIRIPIIESILKLRVMNVTGDTETFTVKSSTCVS